jgi:hypothetical protein
MAGEKSKLVSFLPRLEFIHGYNLNSWCRWPLFSYEKGKTNANINLVGEYRGLGKNIENNSGNSRNNHSPGV